MSNKSSQKKGEEVPDEDAEIEKLKVEIEQERKKCEELEWSAAELEKGVNELERRVLELESGNFDYDDSESRHKYENQRQLNAQLIEQKRWLEHELEEIRMKIQNDKLSNVPDPFMLDWDNLSETELKRLVIQLEKTRSDLVSDLHEAQLKLDKEGREFHHFDGFCRMYRAEINNLNRILDSLLRAGHLPPDYEITTPYSRFTSDNSFSSTGDHTPSVAVPLSPKKMSLGRSSPTKSPTKLKGKPKIPPLQQRSLKSSSASSKATDESGDIPKPKSKTTSTTRKNAKALPKIEKKRSKVSSGVKPSETEPQDSGQSLQLPPSMSLNSLRGALRSPGSSNSAGMPELEPVLESVKEHVDDN